MNEIRFVGLNVDAERIAIAVLRPMGMCARLGIIRCCALRPAVAIWTV
jgi:hypothetical protein